MIMTNPEIGKRLCVDKITSVQHPSGRRVEDQDLPGNPSTELPKPAMIAISPTSTTMTGPLLLRLGMPFTSLPYLSTDSSLLSWFIALYYTLKLNTFHFPDLYFFLSG